MFKGGGGIVWEGGVDHTSVAHSCEKRVGWILGASLYIKGGYILGGRGKFWEGRIIDV